MQSRNDESRPLPPNRCYHPINGGLRQARFDSKLRLRLNLSGDTPGNRSNWHFVP